jgi:hypothetical protein
MVKKNKAIAYYEEYINSVSTEDRHPFHPHPKEPYRYDNAQEKKLVKNLNKYHLYSACDARGSVRVHCFNATADFVNQLESIDAVALGEYIGRHRDQTIGTIIVLSSNNVHILIAQPLQSVLGLIGLIYSSIKASKKPFNHCIYDAQSFLKQVVYRPDIHPTAISIDKMNFCGFEPAAIYNLFKKCEESSPPNQTKSTKVDKYYELEKIASLRDKNIITQEEFDELKKKILLE